MGGTGDTYAAAVEMTAAWNHEHHFELNDDALPAVAALRDRGLKVGLLSNTARDLPVFAAHHGIEADAGAKRNAVLAQQIEPGQPHLDRIEAEHVLNGAVELCMLPAHDVLALGRGEPVGQG